jgi:DNA-directed RNA polymerase subunit M/transcription elongation factor TFIIS
MVFKCIFHSINNYEVQLAKSILDAEGIYTLIPNDQITSIAPYFAVATGMVQLLVSEEDAEKAEDLLKSFKEDIKAEQAKDTASIMYLKQIECPQCGSHKVKLSTKPRLVMILLGYLLSGLPISAKKKIYVCDECHHKWAETKNKNCD